LAVVGAATGERLGRVLDVLFEHESGRMTGFLIRPAGGGHVSRPMLMSWRRVQSVGPGAVVAVLTDGTQGEEGLEPVERDIPVPGSVWAHTRWTGARCGHLVGLVADVEGTGNRRVREAEPAGAPATEPTAGATEVHGVTGL
jgi:uncharacterized protein YrrD